MDLDQLEAFALGDDRERALDQLVPGTVDHFFYRCLLHQHRGELAAVPPLIEAWAARHGRSGRLDEIEWRQAMLSATGGDQAWALDSIRHGLSLRFDHQREIEDEPTSYPTALDQASIGRDAFEREATADAGLSGYSDLALDWLMDGDLEAWPRRELLGRLRLPDHPRLVDHVLADLAEPDSAGFGSLQIHGRLLLPQLEELARRRTRLLEERAFVLTWLVRLRPGPDVDWQTDPAEKEAYLERLHAFTRRLSPSHNSLKAHVLYHRLDHDRARGVYDRSRFVEYLKLPRRSELTPRDVLEQAERRQSAADLSADYRSSTKLPPVADDAPLVTDYLARFLVGADSPDEFAGLVRDEALREVFATTKLLAGVGVPERWTAMLDPARYQALRDRVDIELAPQNRTVYSRADEPVVLEVDVKNVATLIVKVFEINALSHALATGREVDTGVDLDGMVAGEERTLTFDEPPLRRVRRRIELESLRRPGVFVVELIGGGRSSRALLRKGALRFTERLGAAGHVFTILDAEGRHLPDASLWLGGREYLPRHDGTVLVPFTTRPGRATVILRHGELATVAGFEHRDERYELAVGVHLDREQLLSRRTARAIVRPALSIHGVPVDLSLLERPRLHVRTTDRRGVEGALDVAVELPADRELVQELAVPDDLDSIEVSIAGVVRSLSEQRDVELRASGGVVKVNGIDRTPHIEDLHFGRDAAGGFELRVLGKAGEPRPGRPVNLALTHDDFASHRPVHVTLQTDGEGRIALGRLEGIVTVTATSPARVEETFRPPRPASVVPPRVHALAGEVVELPFEPAGAGVELRREVALLERLEGGVLVRDRLDAVELAGGVLRLRGLAPGDYELHLKRRGVVVQVSIAGGEARRGWAVGGHRLLELSPRRRALAIAGVGVAGPNAGAVEVRLANAGPDARVHLIATRFAPRRSALADLGASAAAAPLSSIRVWRPRCHYVSGRDIGDEYRYILERRAARKHAGSMLPRPGLLLNPWAVQQAEVGRAEARGGGAYAASPAAMPQEALRKSKAARLRAEEAQGGEGFSDLDFLAEPSVLLANLRPDAEGVVRVARAARRAATCLRVVAVDADVAVERDAPLAPAGAPPALRDVRLTRGLDPHGRFAEQRLATPLVAGEELVIDDVATAAVETYETVGDAFALLSTLCPSEHLETFRFVTGWHALPEAERGARYSEHACHELNLFLYFKDRPYFDRVVKPYLRHKHEKTFVDRVLLGDDLGEYLEPWAFGRLNVVEKCLLARALPAAAPSIRRHLEERYDLLPPGPEEDDRLFDAALGAGGPGGPGPAGEAMDLLSAGEVMPPRSLAAQSAFAMAETRPTPARFATAAPMPGPMPAMAPAPPGEPAAAIALADVDEATGTHDVRALRRIGDVAARDEVRRLYRGHDATREWAEQHWYRLRLADQGPELVTINAFWRDLARHDGARPFLSAQLGRASRSFAEAMCALAVLELPFESPGHEVTREGARLRIAARGPVLVFHREIRPAAAGAGAAPLLISQGYLRADDRYDVEGGEHREKYVTGELLAQTVYECQVVLTNPTSSRQKLDALLQIPVGAVPVADGFRTRGRRLVLEPFATERIGYSFYFPQPGEAPHFPAQVARNGELVAAAAPAVLRVVARLASVDEASWPHVSQQGEAAQVLRYLDEHNLARLDLSRIAWRMRDRAFFDAVLELLRARCAYDRTLWSYGVLHGDLRAVRELLDHDDWFLRRLGGWLDSPAVRVDPARRGWYEHLEYLPLVNARAHRLGGRTRIVVEGFEAQYRSFLEGLCYKPSIGDRDRLEACAYLLAQDRVAEASEMLARVGPGAVESALQRDYLAAVLALREGDAAAARLLAGPHADHPVDRWRARFQGVLEACGAEAQAVDADDREAEQARLAATEPGFGLSVEKGTVTITYQRLADCRVNYYAMDLELLFSRQPFVQQQAERFSIVRPNRSDVVALPPDRRELAFELPDAYRSRNVIVEVVAAGRREARVSYAHDLLVQLVPQYGQVTVRRRVDGGPEAAAYVKVYARSRGGAVAFYKDGYTDLQGRFDYATLSTDDLDRVERFALLVASETRGAVVLEAAPPQR